MIEDTETLAFALRLKPGGEAEYLKRHDALWPEMRDALLASGILHYEIYLEPGTNLLFAHMIRRKTRPTPSAREAEVLERWRLHMADLLAGGTAGPERVTLRRMFRLVAPEAAAGVRLEPKAS